MMRDRLGAAVLSMLPVLLTCLLIAPRADAGATEWEYSDRVRDSGLVIDVERTTLDVSERGRIRIRVLGREFVRDSTDVVRIFLDTRRANNGPEYRATWYLGRNPAIRKGSAWIVRSDSWATEGRTVRCPGFRQWVNFGNDIIGLSIPRSCINRPAQVRWSGFVARITRGNADGWGGYLDYFPARNRFKSWWAA